MRNVIAMTVFNRPHLTLINTLVKLGTCGADWTKDSEIVMADDGSVTSYEPLLEQFGNLPIRYLKHDTRQHMPEAYSIDGHNNPAHVSNWLLSQLDCENLFWMSSDIMVRPLIVCEALKLDLQNVVWMPCVVELDTNYGILCPNRIAPFGWFYGTRIEHFRSVQWDESYMRGIAFEDNDFMARLALHVGRFVIDKNVVVWHQSHPQAAYSDKMKGWKTNEAYTREKWGGIPWHSQLKCPLELNLTHVNHQMVLDVRMQKGREMQVA